MSPVYSHLIYCKRYSGTWKWAGLQAYIILHKLHKLRMHERQDRHYHNFVKKKRTNLQYRRGCRSWTTPLNSSVPVERLPDSFHPESNEPKTNLFKGQTSSSISNHTHSLHQNVYVISLHESQTVTIPIGIQRGELLNTMPQLWWSLHRGDRETSDHKTKRTAETRQVWKYR